MILNKVMGYVLLVAGLLLIVIPLWQTFNIFTDRAQAPLVFKTRSLPSEGSGQDVQSQINEAVKKQVGQIIPPDSITKILNLTSWALLASILIMAGGAISGVGVKLINGKS